MHAFIYGGAAWKKTGIKQERPDLHINYGNEEINSDTVLYTTAFVY